MAANPIRLRRLQNAAGSILMVPMDHGISLGPARGLRDPAAVLQALAPHATCTTLHRGLVRHASDVASDLGVMMHLSASTDVGPSPNDKRLVASVEDAVRAGCDGVSIHINLGSSHEPKMIQDAGTVASACDQWGMPLLAMIYPRGQAIHDPFDPALIAHAARLGGELGADMVKVPFTGDAETFRPAVEGATIPVVVAGGPKQDSFDGFLEQVRAAQQAGAMGVSVGRNIFQRKDPATAMSKLADIFP